MLVACHLYAGLFLGLVLFKYPGDRRVILLSGLGAILPDLVDKPLGHVIYRESIGSGRLFLHGLLFLMLIVFLGILIWRWKRSAGVLALSYGVLSHQALDRMWNQPVEWLYPLLGPYTKHDIPRYFLESILRELSSVSEWVFFASCLIIIASIYPPKLTEKISSNRGTYRLVSITLLFMGAYSLITYFAGTENLFLLSSEPLEALTIGLVSLTGIAIPSLLRVGGK